MVCTTFPEAQAAKLSGIRSKTRALPRSILLGMLENRATVYALHLLYIFRYAVPQVIPEALYALRGEHATRLEEAFQPMFECLER